MLKQCTTFSKQTLFYLQVILWLVLLLPFNLFFQSILSDHIIISFTVFGSACLAGVSIFLAKDNKHILQITIADILASCYFIYILVNTYIIRPYPVPDIMMLKYLLAFFIYLSVRMMKNKEKIYGLSIICVIGLVEAIIILLQACGLVESEHLIFNYTGSFFNPGLAGCFIACSLCILIYYLVTVPKLSKRLFLSAGAILLSYTLLLTNSRAGWIAAIIGVCYVLWHSNIRFIKWGKRQIKKMFLPKVILAGLIISGMIFCYQFKKSSADGRLFIWKVCLEMVKDKPLTGHGVGMFRSKFPHYQATFFVQNPNSNDAFVAGNPSSPFNEYLSVLVTQGFIGFTLLTIILLSLFMHRSISRKQKMQQAFLLTFCVFAFFSYPTEHYRTLILLPFFIAILPAKRILTIHYKKIGFILFIPVVLAGIYFSVRTMNEYLKLEQAFKLQNRISTEKYEEIKWDIDLLKDYYTYVGNKLPEAEEFMLVKDYVDLYPSSIGLCELGRRYKAVNNYDEARKHFTFASNINPSLITPYYELFLIYQEESNINNMKTIGEIILHHNTKKESTISIKIKAKVKKALNELEEHNILT